MPISVFLADDNLIVREGVKALLEFEDDVEVVGQGADYDELVHGAESTQPQVIVTDIRMPPDFSREGIDAAKEVRRRHPGHRCGDPVAVRRPRLRGGAALRGGRRLRLPAQGPRRRGRPARPGRARGGRGRLHARPQDRRGADHPGASRRIAVEQRRGAAPAGRPGPDGQRHRRAPQDDPGGGRRRGRRALREAGRGPRRRPRRQPGAAPHAAAGDRGPQGAGRRPESPAPRRRRRADLPGGPPARGVRGDDGDGPDVRHPRLHDDRRACGPQPARRAAARAPGRP